MLPSRRSYIEKGDGRKRLLGITALEDKIVQHAVVTILNNIYEEDFLGFSYGFRPVSTREREASGCLLSAIALLTAVFTRLLPRSWSSLH